MRCWGRTEGRVLVPVDPATVGFIGLGTMGGPMAGHLLTAGHAVVVWNRTPEKMEPLVTAGADAGTGPGDVAGRSDVVMLCVSDTPDVVEVVAGPGGVLAGLRPGSLVVDHSTISPEETRRLAGLIAEAGAAWVDARSAGGRRVRSAAAWR